MQKILDILRGVVLNPALTAFARGLLEALAFAALYAVSDAIASGALADEVGVFGPFIILAIRSLEGLVDRIDPVKIRQNNALDANLPDSIARDTISQ